MGDMGNMGHMEPVNRQPISNSGPGLQTVRFEFSGDAGCRRARTLLGHHENNGGGDRQIPVNRLIFRPQSLYDPELQRYSGDRLGLRPRYSQPTITGGTEAREVKATNEGDRNRGINL